MKILCIGRNYGEHARELGNAPPEEPVLFLKPESAVLGIGEAFRLPDWTREVHHEVELVFHIATTCSNVSQEEAMRCVDGVTVGIDFTARDVQAELKKKGLPWEKAKAFDGSAVVGERFVEVPAGTDDLRFELRRNGAVVQQGTAGGMLFPVPALIAHASRFITLHPGDLLFTGTPAGVGPVAAGDHLEGFLNGARMFALRVEG